MSTLLTLAYGCVALFGILVRRISVALVLVVCACGQEPTESVAAVPGVDAGRPAVDAGEPRMGPPPPPPSRRDAATPIGPPPPRRDAGAPAAMQDAGPATPPDAGPPPFVERPRPPPTVVPAPRRLVAMGDVHGDFRALFGALTLAGLVDAEGAWIGGDAVVVQVGDQTDRGDDERLILDYLEYLADRAHEAGGAVYALLGNHEVMNVDADFRYVTAGGWADFADVPHDPNDTQLRSYPAEQRGRVAAFRPGGPYASILAGHNVVMVVGDTVFVHGGILPAHVTFGLSQINQQTQTWMERGGRKPDILRSDTAPIWSRHYSSDTGPDDCALAQQVLSALGARRIVVAHTVQSGINSACGGQVYRVDVGMAAYYGGTPEALEIVGSRVRILR